MLGKVLLALRLIFWVTLVLVIITFIWWGGPELRFGDSRPLEPISWRLGLIGLILLIFLLPAILHFFHWLWQKLTPVSKIKPQDNLAEKCAEQLRNMVANAESDAPSYAHRWLRRFRFSPDYLLVGENNDLVGLIANWPHEIQWDSNETSAGRAFRSMGKTWLIMPMSMVPYWARLLLWRRSPRSVVIVMDRAILDDTSLQQRLDAWQTFFSLWRKHAGRVLPYWLLLLERDHLDQSAWTIENQNLPWGFTLSRRQPLDYSRWEKKLADFFTALRLGIPQPTLAPVEARARLRLLNRCVTSWASINNALKQLCGRRLFVNNLVRGVFWSWASPGMAWRGLPGFLDIIHSDRVAPTWRPSLAILRIFFFLMIAIITMFWTIDQTINRSERHQRVQNEWINAVERYGDFVRDTSQDANSTLRTLTLLDDIDTLAADSSTTLHEPLPASLHAMYTFWHDNVLTRKLLPMMQADNQERLESGIITADRRYMALAYGLMLDNPAHMNQAFVRQALEDQGLAPDRVDSSLSHLLRGTAPRDSFPEQLAVKWRADLLAKRYTLQNRIWSGIADTPLPSDAHPFSLVRTMGPTSVWFVEGDEIPWLFTNDGLIRGFRSAKVRYADWAEEYAWVMGYDAHHLSLDDQEELQAIMRMRYVHESVAAWQSWFSAIRLQPAQTLPDAFDLAQLFGSSDSPIIKLLAALKANMPFQLNNNQSIWQRFQQRINNDWRHLQYFFGWRRSLQSSQQGSDPSIAISQHFAILQRYFSDDKGVSPPQDRLFAMIQRIADHLERLSSSQQLSVMPPPGASLTYLRNQALKLPQPLREITLSMIAEGETEITKVTTSRLQSLRLDLDKIPSYQKCRLAPPFPFNRESLSELYWNDFVDDFSPQGRIAQFIATHSETLQILQTSVNSSIENQKKSNADIEWLQRASAISKAWFPKEMQPLKFSLTPVYMTPDIRFVRLRIGERYWSYAHGQPIEQIMEWNPDTDIPAIEMEISGVDGEVTHLNYNGPWSLLKWAREARQETQVDKSKILLEFPSGSGRLQVVLAFKTNPNPLDPDLYENFCEVYRPPHDLGLHLKLTRVLGHSWEVKAGEVHRDSNEQAHYQNRE